MAPVGGYDNGSAGFGTSPAARSAVNALNPLSPGGMNPNNTHAPTLAWAVIFVAVGLIVYHTVIKKGR
jgi:hypothetical protein